MTLKPDNKPLISIVLPTYNRASMLGPAVESCLGQTWRNLELIIVDDGSSDNTSEIAERFAKRDPRVRYIRQENGKIPKALNTGFAAAQGELLTWTSDDNLYEPEAVETMATFLIKKRDIGLVYCNYKVIDEKGNLVGISRLQPPLSLLYTNVVGACFMYRHSIAEVVGNYDPETFLAEDYDYWLRISKVAPLALLDNVTPYQYRHHKKSLTSVREVEALLQAGRVSNKYAVTDRQRKRISGHTNYAVATALRTVGKYAEARKYYLRAALAIPLNLTVYRGLIASCISHAPRME